MCYLLWQYQELKKFEVTEYELHSKKVTEELRIVMISDLHAHVYGKDNEPLFSAVREKSRDLILIPGDMIVGREPASYEHCVPRVRGAGAGTHRYISPMETMRASRQERIFRIARTFLRMKDRVKNSGCIS